MNDKPQHISGYDTESTTAVRRLCLLVATHLNDVMPDVRIVGGLVPSLIIDFTSADDIAPHVGTLDLDLGLQLAVLDGSQYQEIARRLRSAGFTNDKNEMGSATRQRWVHTTGLTVDFLIPPVDERSRPGGLQDLDHDFAAVITPALELAFKDFLSIELEDVLPSGEHVSRSILACGPGAFLILKALAFRNRAEPKDAYDLHFVLRHWSGGLDDVVRRVHELYAHPLVGTAVHFLEEDFSTIDSIGPGYLDSFLTGEGSVNEQLRADISGLILTFCRRLENLRQTDSEP